VFIKRLYAHAQAMPKQTAIVWNGHPVTYLRFAQVVESLRADWSPLALPRGSTAVVVVNSLIENWAAVLALQSLGLVTVCAKSLADAGQLGLTDISCVVMCAVKAEKNTDTPHSWAGVQTLPIPPKLYARPWAKKLPLLDDLADSADHILYTSGTTGEYKKIFHDGTLDALRYAKRMLTDGLDARHVCHAINFGLWTAIGFRRPLCVWHAGGCMVFDQRSDWALRLGDNGVTHVSLTPNLLAEALKALGPDHARVRGWAFQINVGGGFLSANLARQTREQLTSNLTINFGTSETWLSPMRAKAEDLSQLHWLQPWQDREVEIVTEEGQVCPDGVEGLLRVKLTSLDHTEYMNDPVSTAKAFRDGWFYPGDLAVKRGDGAVRVLGRALDVVNIGGLKVATAPIEEAVQQALGVNVVCVFSGLDQSGEDGLVVALETSESIDKSKLQSVVSKLPSGTLVRFVGMREFPRTQSGTQKVNRIALRQLVMNPSRSKS
jgi:acyl-coenzyme A synthetase/AMP-(fatty) acid ligase